MASEKKSSFQKRNKAKIIQISGCRPSLHNSQLLVSTGIPSLDFILGGGLPIGSILLIEEDKYDVYSKTILKYFMSEGIVHHNILNVASLDILPSNILKTLPAPKTRGTPSNKNTNTPMTIAWRYEGQKTTDPNDTCEFGHTFDLTKFMPKDLIENSNISSWNGNSNDSFEDLLNSIVYKIKEEDLFINKTKPSSNVIRHCIHSLGSPYWGSKGTDEIVRFLYLLKAIIRNSYSIAMVTIPSHLFNDKPDYLRLYSPVDFIVNLESFQGSDKETNPIFKDYHGLFIVKKLPILNSIIPHNLESTDWVFRLKRKGLRIERLHLPPSFSDGNSQSEGSCQGDTLPSKIDF